MSLIYQIPRNALWWLLIAQAAVILPHLNHLPIWLLLVWSLAVGWRVQMVRGAWGGPNRWLKALCAIGCVVALIISYGRLFALEPLVALLTVAFVLKLLELNRQRDVLLVLLLGFFVTATQLLFTSSLFAFIYAIFCCWLLITALMALHMASRSHSLWDSFGKSGGYMLQALPLAILLFFVMPRIGSLWSVPMAQGQGKTGFSKVMAPGNIRQLNKDFSPAFRVTFNGPTRPQNRDLYWRGMVLSDYDGRSWQLPIAARSERYYYNVLEKSGGPPWLREIGAYSGQRQSPVYDYRVMLEPHRQPWLFALPTAIPISADINSTNNYNLLRSKPVNQRLLYQVRSFPGFARQAAGLSRAEWQINTRIPKSFNPKTQALAQEWAGQYSQEQLIAQLLGLFNQSFSYSLDSIAAPGRHAVDEFLFTNQRGYCEHYAGAFVFFLRAAGIPARVVVGYQGGEWLSEEQYLLVSQADAHAWAEVWLPAKGWQRYDPTSAVAPERIELGFREYIERASASGMEQAADFRQAAFLTMLRLRLDVLNYSWQSWVLGYNQEQQMQLFERFLGGREYWRIGALLLIGASLIMGCFGFVLWWRTRPLPPPANLKPWLALEQRLRRYGYKREQGETPQQFVQRVGRDYPSAQPLLSRFSQMAYRLLYEAEQDSDSQQKLQRQMRRLLATLKLETGNR